MVGTLNLPEYCTTILNFLDKMCAVDKFTFGVGVKILLAPRMVKYDSVMLDA